MAKQGADNSEARVQQPWEIVLLLPEEAAQILKTTVDTLADWRFHKRGPKWIKVERLIRYRECDLREYLESRLQKDPQPYQPHSRSK